MAARERGRRLMTRAERIEKEARVLVAWCDEFVGTVLDNSGNSLTKSGEWQEVLGTLRAALQPHHVDLLPSRATSPCERRGLRCSYHPNENVCAICGWPR